MSPARLDDRFFTLLTFMHIAVPLFLLLVLWIHLQRVSRPQINPPRGLAIGTFAMMMALSLAYPAVSQGPADLAKVTAEIGLDWFYLAVYPLIDRWSSGPVWGFVVALSLIAVALPWLPPLRSGAVALVHLDNCNGCTRCAEDCPTGAITMAPRSDGLPFDREAQVDPDLCVSCGICAGACPTATPFRRASALVPGIELPDRSLADLRSEIEAAAGPAVRGPAGSGLRLRARRAARRAWPGRNRRRCGCPASAPCRRPSSTTCSVAGWPRAWSWRAAGRATASIASASTGPRPASPAPATPICAPGFRANGSACSGRTLLTAAKLARIGAPDEALPPALRPRDGDARPTAAEVTADAPYFSYWLCRTQARRQRGPKRSEPPPRTAAWARPFGRRRAGHGD